MNNLVKVISVVIVSSIFLSCITKPVKKFDELNYWPTEKWQTGTPESQGIDSNELLEILNKIDDKNLRVDSIVVIRNGVKIMDVVKYPYKRDIPHSLYSCTKSVMSILIGIAIDKGYIDSVDTPVLSFFPEYVAEELSSGWESMTLKHLLTMTSGIANDMNESSSADYWEMQENDDWVDYILRSELYTKPEIKKFSYSNMTSFLLGAILKKQTGESPLDFANENLFKSLGITNMSWPTTSPDGVQTGATDLNLVTSDFAKIGLLFLQNGKWEGKQIISEQWIIESTKQHVVNAYPMGMYGYGYQWWKDVRNGYYAAGSLGQYLIVNQDKNMIVAINSSISDSEYLDSLSVKNSFNHSLANTFQETTLLEKTNGQEMLNKKIEEWERKMYSVGINDSDSLQALNKTYQFDDNIWKHNSVKLEWDGSKGSILIGNEVEENLLLELNLNGIFKYSVIEGDYLAYRTYIDDDGDIALVFRNLTKAHWFKYVFNIKESEIVVDISHNMWEPEGDFQIKGHDFKS